MNAIQVIDEWAGHFRDPAVNADKVWAAAYTSSAHYLAVWGRRSTTYQSQAKHLPTVGEAARLFRARRDEKASKGYRAVRFGDPTGGDIPSFAAGGVTDASPAARITLDGVLAELAAVPERLRRAGPHLPDAVLAYAQARLKAELLLDGGALAEPERRACLAALAHAREAVGLALVA